MGWGLSKGIAVLDIGSICVSTEFNMKVCWPYNGMKNVPVSFSPEMPNPLPGLDQSQWGYPISLQLFGNMVSLNSDVRMTLFKGSNPNSQKVPCFFSSPSHPTNPKLTPVGAYCLIPKNRLSQSSVYCVKAELSSGGKHIIWTFKTK